MRIGRGPDTPVSLPESGLFTNTILVVRQNNRRPAGGLAERIASVALGVGRKKRKVGGKQ